MLPTTAKRRTRLLPVPLAAVLGLALTACSTGSSAGELSTAPSVTDNGEHYAYAPGTVDHASWPKVCSLLSTESAAAAIGTTVTAKRFHDRCYYIPGNDAFPTLTVTILAIGSDQHDAFDRTRDENASYAPKTVNGVGEAAVVYRLANSPTVNLDMLAHQGLFEIALRSPVGNQASAATSRSVLGKVGRAIAEEFSG